MSLSDPPVPPPRRVVELGSALLRGARRLGDNLVCAALLALPLPRLRGRFHVDVDQLAALMLLGFGADILSGYLAASERARFWTAGWAGESVGTIALLLGCYLAARLARAPAIAPALVIMMLGAGIILDIPYGIIAWARPGDHRVDAIFGHLVWPVYLAWFVLIGMRSMRALLPARSRLVMVSGLLVALGPVTPWGLELSYPFWYEPPAEESGPAVPPLDVERTYYAQPALLDRALAGIGAHPMDVPTLYFVGFAGWAEQDVFLKEGVFARHLLDQKFGTAGHSILLANNRASVAELPLASVSNLGFVLDRIGVRMDREQDALFLFLTSHGSPGRFAVSFDPLELDALPADKLRQLLDHAGIKWRIIVISACYSGSFIDALKDAHTLVMTAARQDRTSFGCSSENDFTYFGEAYFGQALQHTRSFLGAFDQAKASIAEREKTEGLTPSEPQIFIGEAIRPKLAELEATLPLP